MSNATYPADTQPTASGVNAPIKPADARIVSRRWLLFKAGIALNGIVGFVLAVPVFRYLLTPWKKDASFNSWTSLGPIN